MTDLLGLLTDLHTAVTRLGSLHISITDVEGHPGMVDHVTRTIHISPGLGLVDSLGLIAKGVAALAPPEATPISPQVAVGGEDIAAVMPPDRHLRVVQ